MTKHEMSLNFSGITHDHSVRGAPGLEGPELEADGDKESNCSTIAILRRHPMYDCLVLVKKYRQCLNGYSLEFPTNKLQEEEEDAAGGNKQQDENSQQATQRMRNCYRRKLVSRFLDGDDPMYQSSCLCSSVPSQVAADRGDNAAAAGPISGGQLDEGQTSSDQVVHVPVNGLLDRLKNYTESGLAVDARVYAFAMGLKTAERILTTGAMREIQETPI